MDDNSLFRRIELRRCAGGAAAAGLAVLSVACSLFGDRQPAHTPTRSGSVGQAQEAVQAQVDQFGWTEDGKVFHSIKVDDMPQWYNFDPVTATTEAWARPDLAPEVMDRLSEGGSVEVLQKIVSPSGARILYTRLPEGYGRPSFETPIPDYYPPAELWLAEGG